MELLIITNLKPELNHLKNAQNRQKKRSKNVQKIKNYTFELLINNIFHTVVFVYI